MSTLSGSGVLGGLAESTAAATYAANQLRARPWPENASPTTPAMGAILSAPLNVFGASPALADNTTLQTLVNVAGSGILLACEACFYRIGYQVSLTVQIVIDGVTYIDETSTSPSGTDDIVTIRAVGSTARISSTPYSIVEHPLYYRSSLQIKAQKSITIGNFAMGYTNLLANPYGG